MARKFICSDLHLGHGNIAIYAGRPWVKDHHLKENGWTWIDDDTCKQVTETMNFNLIHRWNERVSPEDTVFHLGDFCVRGRARGCEGLRYKADEYEKQLNGKIIHILGNHDQNNGVKHGLDSAVITLSGYRFLLIHRPVMYTDMELDGIDCVLCGHVHEKWKYRYSSERDLLEINVGVDVCDYYPLTHEELFNRFKTYQKEVKNNESHAA